MNSPGSLLRIFDIERIGTASPSAWSPQRDDFLRHERCLNDQAADDGEDQKATVSTLPRSS